MKRILQTFFGGALVILPFAVSGYFVWWLATKLGGLGQGLLQKTKLMDWIKDTGALSDVLSWFLGSVIVIGLIYGVGLLTRLYVFRQIVQIVERWITHVPGVKTIYESVRDLMKLFGGDSARMGRAVLYRIPQTDISVLGILTNEQPVGVSAKGERKVAVFLPFSYMFGGPTIYVSPEHILDAGMTVDQALKLCATAHVGGQQAAPLNGGKNEPPPETKI